MLQVLIHLILLLKKDFIALKSEVGKLDINELVTVLTGLNDGKLKTVPIDLKTLSDEVRKEVVKKTV